MELGSVRYIYTDIYMNIYDYFVYLVKLKPFAVETGYHCYLKICIYNLQSCYQTST